MDNKTRANPLLVPPDEVLRSALYLDSDPNFKILSNWIHACYAVTVNRGPTIKDETEMRWNQVQSQALLLINKALGQAREELLARQRDAEKNAISRNA